MHSTVYIYAIQHNITKRIYIGQSAVPMHRYMIHMCSLRSFQHNSKEMQKDFNKYGEDFSFFILEQVDNNVRVNYSTKNLTNSIAAATIIERGFMELYRTTEKRYGYNVQDRHSKRSILNCNYKDIDVIFGLPEIPRRKYRKGNVNVKKNDKNQIFN